MIEYRDLKDVFCEVFGSDVEVPENASYLDVENWDSLKHVVLIMTLQNHFGVEIDNDVAVELSSVSKIINFLNENKCDRT